ncbi:tol-pal system protein YbgF [Kerstersia gyiorum]|jgi:tol-pal system protein YbgF|uniref:Cell division coordinator CpoB n=1 Tax=Kerstersia gyiorum TaxID=206506 RepID=A0A171KNY6_9BURK|nr:tol-pal system protein YbgF [Kerstersia gyiorum]AZV92754.1 tol-pal system protein YbgF [Bordetella sp. J329]MCO7642272.1 tol-pal system protein YbgF [Pseudomonas sp. S 311-6]KAB0542245.1 tol-pal system protein YbgF [Kerstersia gyiorum]KKO70603.1 hypothetical protein AAV32_15130 [Kerstersia gyiorum]MCH4272966.1 tol-pal system protein YbgF [Kerstersia gyiorum]
MTVSTSSLRKHLLSASILAILATPLTAHAFADDDARRAILELRQQVRQLTEQNQRAQLQLADQIDALQLEVMRLRDQVEHASRSAQQAMEQSAPKPAANTEDSAADPQEQAAYDGAINLFRNGQYGEASEALNAFVVLYPDSSLAPSARFYQGSSRYAQKDYKGAVTLLEDMVNTFPSSQRAPDALLVIAGSKVELNDRAGAKAALQRIVKDYPTTPAAETAAKRLQLL